MYVHERNKEVWILLLELLRLMQKAHPEPSQIPDPTLGQAGKPAAVHRQDHHVHLGLSGPLHHLTGHIGCFSFSSGIDQSKLPPTVFQLLLS